MNSRTSANLPLQLASAYTLLALYGSLYPFSDWRDSGVAPLAFLTTGWLRYTTAFDLVMNALAYLPFGFLWVTVLSVRLKPAAAFVARRAGGRPAFA